MSQLTPLFSSAIRQGVQFRIEEDRLTSDAAGNETVDAILTAYAERPAQTLAALQEFDRRYRIVLEAMQHPNVYTPRQKAEIAAMARGLGIELTWKRIELNQ